MKNFYRSYVFTGLLTTLAVVGFTGCEKTEGVADSQQTPEYTNTDANKNSMDAAQKAFDTQLVKKVKQAIMDEETLAGFDITVSAKNGVIQLTGDLDTRAEHDLVMKIAKDVNGVDRISDMLRIKQ